MTLKRALKIIWLCVIFSTVPIISVFSAAYSAEFQIEEIITAIKQDIQTARMTGEGNPNFTIETVKVDLTVVSTETRKGTLNMKVAGIDLESRNGELDRGARHKLSFTLTPTGSPGFFPEASFGLVEPINKIKSSLRKAYNNPPSSELNRFTIKLQFAIEELNDRGFQFNVFDVNEFRAQNIPIHQATIKMKLEN